MAGYPDYTGDHPFGSGGDLAGDAHLNYWFRASSDESQNVPQTSHGSGPNPQLVGQHQYSAWPRHQPAYQGSSEVIQPTPQYGQPLVPSVPYDTHSPGFNPSADNSSIGLGVDQLTLQARPYSGQQDTSRQATVASVRSIGTYGSYVYSGHNVLDQNIYFMRPDDFFQAGRVIKVLWSESVGDLAPITRRPQFSEVFLGGVAYTNIQRFVIIRPRPDQHVSFCCPIKTYNYQGTNKAGIKQDPHGVIFTGASQPPLLENEAPLRKKAIRMDPINPRALLDPASRINYGKPTPVEHNLKVEYIGDINPAYLYRLFRYYDEENNTATIRSWALSLATRDPRNIRSSDRNSRSIRDEDDDDSEDDDNEDEDDDDDDQPVPVPITTRRENAYGRRPSMSGQRESRGRGGRDRQRTETRAHRDRSNTTRSSPVPFGSQSLVPANSRRYTSEQLEPLVDPRARNRGNGYGG